MNALAHASVLIVFVAPIVIILWGTAYLVIRELVKELRGKK